jgi:hypothetical protein
MDEGSETKTKKRDPIGDVLEDDENEFISGIVPEDKWQVQQEQPDNVTEEPEAHGKRHAQVRKKRKQYRCWTDQYKVCRLLF